MENLRFIRLNETGIVSHCLVNANITNNNVNNNDQNL